MGNPASGRTVSSGFRFIGLPERLSKNRPIENENAGNDNDNNQEFAGEII